MTRITRTFVIGCLSGAIGAQSMTAATTLVYALTPEEIREQERTVSPGPAHELASRHIARALGIELRADQLPRFGLALHILIGIVGGQGYMTLRRTGVRPAVAALAVSLAIWALIDEGMVPSMGWSAPNAEYPAATHLRGLIGHLTLGTTVAVSAELLCRFLNGAGR